MKTVIGIVVGVILVLAFQKIFFDDNSDLNTTYPTQPSVAAKAPIPPDFLVFYTQFHTDSTFQMAHINFPLEGVPAYADSTTLRQRTFRWQKDDWQMHKLTEERRDNFHEDLHIASEGFIVEFIPTGDQKLWIERRFLKSGKDWRLIFYSGLNKRD